MIPKLVLLPLAVAVAVAVATSGCTDENASSKDNADGSTDDGDGGTGGSSDGGADPDASPIDPTACRQVISTRITVPTTLTNGPEACDYLVSGNIRVTSALTIEAGTTVVFGQDSRWFFVDQGSIQAIGTEDEPIVLQGVESLPGYWYGLCFADNRASRLEYVALLNAGKVYGLDSCRGAIGDVGAGEPISIVDSLIAGAHTTGLDATDLVLGDFARNVFAGNLEYGVRVSARNMAKLDSESDYLGNSVGRPNALPYVSISGTDLRENSGTHRWPALGIPYYIGDTTHPYWRYVNLYGPNTTVEIAPGATFMFGPGAGLNVYDDATLVGSGTAGAKIVFRGTDEVPGHWDGLNVGDSAITLDYAEISWGGQASGSANLHIFGNKTTRQSSLGHMLIRGSGSCGIRIDEYTSPLVILANMTYSENAEGDECGSN